ncbi:PilZ domain-containing protein [Shewanella donghaensis]|uniref:PilZ domain-containing protein n=1 Tax=Shewanella donghaensis TaxID=238836 RepID=UPI001D044A5F|nr:flagellar brake protein [Shewanella donghaensis]
MEWNRILTPQDEQIFFSLMPGSMVDLQIDFPVKFRTKATLVGFEIGKYIILKHPAPLQMNNYKDVFVDGNGVVVRYLLEGQQGECFAFKTTIRNVTKFPEKFIFLTYPKEIENRQLRTHQRFVTHLPSSIQAREDGKAKQGTELKGIISDISSKGCGFLFKTDNENLKVNEKDIFVNIRNPNDETTTIPAKVCNSRFENGKVNVGIKFEDNDPQIKKLLNQLFIDL